MSDVKTVLSKVDWTLFRKQKAALVAAADSRGEPTGDHLLGVVHLLDAIQDAVVADGLASERAVFGRLNAKRRKPRCPKCGSLPHRCRTRPNRDGTCCWHCNNAKCDHGWQAPWEVV